MLHAKYLLTHTAKRIEQIKDLALETFGSENAASQFLSSPHPSLNDRTPLEACESEHGSREVEWIINKGLYGLPT